MSRCAFIAATICLLGPPVHSSPSPVTLLSQQGSSGSHTLTGGKWKIDFDKMRQYVVGTEHKYRAVRRLGAPDPSQGPEPEPEPGGEPAEMPTGL